LTGSFRQNAGQTVTITTSKPHRLISGQNIFLSFAGTKAPASRHYYIEVTGPKTFTIDAEGLGTGTYSQAGNLLTVTCPAHRLAPGYQVCLTFTSGGAPNGIYTVTSVLSSSVFTVNTSDSANRSGNCLFPEWAGTGLSQYGTNITVTTDAPHGLALGNNVYMVFPSTNPSTNGVYKIVSVLSPYQFTIRTTVWGVRYDLNALVLPLAAAPATRSGAVSTRYSTWGMNGTDGGYGSSLFQTPLRSPTVFNFFYPDYKFPGVLSSAGLTTPEFQLTSDTTTVMQMNYFTTSIFNNGGNINGLSSLSGGDGSIALDLAPWMTPAQTSDSAIPALVDSLACLLCAGQVSPATKQIIVNYVANPRFPFTGPTVPQMRDRVSSVVQLILTSPEFTIQR
jgi:hypothetical protein